MTVTRGSYDMNAEKQAHDDAEKRATNYVADITNGIMVHPENDSTTGWKIANTLELLISGVTYMKAWIESNIPKIQIGRSDSGNVLIDSDSVDVRDGTTVLATFGENVRIGNDNIGGNVLIDSDSVNMRDGIKTLASFGVEGVQIGADDNARVTISPSKTEMLTRYGDAYFSAASSGGGSSTTTESYVIASNKTMTNSSMSDMTKMISCIDVGAAPLSLLNDGDTFTITLKISHYHKNNSSPSATFEKILSRTITHTLTKGVEEYWDGESYSIVQSPDFFSYDTRISLLASGKLQLWLWNFTRDVGNNSYSYRVSLDEATLSTTTTREIPLITLGGDTTVDGNLKTLGSLFTGMADEFAKGTGTNHIIIAGYHVCFGAEPITLATANTYQEVDVLLPYTYTSAPICFASFQNRAGRARTAYCTAKGDGNNPVTYTGVYVGCYGTTANQNYNVNWLTIGK